MNRASQGRGPSGESHVLLLSTSYPSNERDWRGVFMRHLVAALARQENLRLYVWAPPGDLPASATSVTTPREQRWLSRLMAEGGISHLMRTSKMQVVTAPLQLVAMISAAYRRHRAIDLYHVNWLQCALPLPNDGKPVLITVLGNDLKLLRLPFMRRLLRRVMRQRKSVICPNAEWMLQPLQAAFGDIAEIAPVSFGIDPQWYAIKRDTDAWTTKRWLAVTRLTANKLGPLFEWSEELFSSRSGRELHLFGPMQEDLIVPHWVHYHGAATPEQLALEWFPNACGLITLSRHAEGRPQVMLEAMASGLPIVASSMEAHASIIDDGTTGLLCDSPETYAAALLTLEDSATNSRMGEASRSWALREIGTWDDCARRYTRIYQKLLGDNRIE